LNNDQQTERFAVFLAYEEDTGRDLALHLRQTLEKRQIHTFVARVDIPKAIQYLTDDWRTQIDRVINSCNIFTIILSGRTLTTEMTREVSVAIDRKKKDSKLALMICRYEEIPRTSGDISLATGLDTSLFQQIDFGDKVDLARKVNLEIDDSGFALKSKVPETQQPVGRPAFEPTTAMFRKLEPLERLRPTTREFPLSKFQELVDYAFSIYGLNMTTKKEAAEWAESRMKQSNLNRGHSGSFVRVVLVARASEIEWP
jgi:hypothetical protein